LIFFTGLRRIASAHRVARTAGVLVAGGVLTTGVIGEAGDARAVGSSKSLTFFHTHTKESATITFWRDGRFDDGGLKQINWFLRDWRVNEPANMDPNLFQILWEVYRESGSQQPIHIVSAYRSPKTNAMLRQRSNGVSEHSQHMLGKAMDVRLPDVETGKLRAIAMRMQYGGVGYYPSSAFVHVDTGSVRAWPRMSEDQLARLFPDGKTVHLPPSGKPLARYEEAKVEVLSRKQALASAGAGGNPFSGLVALFRGGAKPTSESAPAAPAAPGPIVVASASDDLDVAATAALTVPLPPRRPTDQLLAFREGAPPAPAPITFPRAELPAPSVETMSVASRLLFSSASVSVTLAKTQPEPVRATAATLLPRELTRAETLSAGQTFSGGPSNAGAPVHRFTTAAVSESPNWRLADGSLPRNLP
jgi:uncharacterized protein YcbK (DUF882 family)